LLRYQRLLSTSLSALAVVRCCIDRRPGTESSTPDFASYADLHRAVKHCTLLQSLPKCSTLPPGGEFGCYSWHRNELLIPWTPIVYTLGLPLTCAARRRWESRMIVALFSVCAVRAIANLPRLCGRPDTRVRCLRLPHMRSAIPRSRFPTTCGHCTLH